MSVAWPTWPELIPREFSLAIRSNVIISHSTQNGSITTSQLPGTRWVCRLMLPGNVRRQDVQADIEGFIASIEGQANRILLHHMRRPLPRGTMRGAPTSAGAGRGARTMVLSVAVGETLRKGDMLGVVTSSGTQLIMVTNAVMGTGLITITFAGPLRAPVAAGSVVTWDRPTAEFILATPDVPVVYGPGINPGVSLELVETFL